MTKQEFEFIKLNCVCCNLIVNVEIESRPLISQKSDELNTLKPTNWNTSKLEHFFILQIIDLHWRNTSKL